MASLEQPAAAASRRVLVVGATGQLGSETVRQAVDAGHRVRALVRPNAAAAHLRRPDVEVVAGDLRDRSSLERAVIGVTDVVATATVMFPRGRSSLVDDEGRGYENLVAVCRDAAVERILFVSVVPLRDGRLEAVPFLRMKRRCENLLRESGLRYTVFRCAPFMDEYFAIMGSSIPLRDEVAASLSRCTGVARAMRMMCGRTIERFGVAIVPGPQRGRHAFVAVGDVAGFLVAALSRPHEHEPIVDVAGPASLSWREVADVYARLLGRRVRVVATPPGLFRLLSHLARPFSEALANQLSVLWIMGASETCVDAELVARRFEVPLTSAHVYLARKIGTVR